jgi:hypothetical protein
MLLAIAGVVASGARPETVVIIVLFAFLSAVAHGWPRALLQGVAAATGGATGLLMIGLRNARVSGLLLPTTFYVKANLTSQFDTNLQHMGFIDLLGHIPLLNSGIVLAALTILCVFLVLPSGRAGRPGAVAGALFLSGTAFCVVSFALVPPVDAVAFYHQRYVLPAVMPMIASMPIIVALLFGRLKGSWAGIAKGAICGALTLGLLLAIPARAARLSNDAHNIDDVQVAFGKALAAVPPSTVLWAIDAGASRYFGHAFVVDMIGLNAPEMLTSHAQAFLDAHHPRYLDLFPGWSQVDRRLPGRLFETSTRYTVTSAASMRLHVLLDCSPPGVNGRFTVRRRVWGFRCSF